MNKHGGYYGKKEGMIDFSVNINPLGTSPFIKDKIINSIDRLDKYPEIDGISAKTSIAKHLGISKDNIILGNGAIELIYLFASTHSNKKVLIIQPTFNEYERAFKMSSSKIYYFINTIENNFKISIESLEKYISKISPDIIVLCNPNNPTGVYTNYSTIEYLCRKFSNITWFIDESFIDFSRKPDGLHLINRYNIFLLRSVTKFHALPGLRAGYAISSKKIIDSMASFKQPWSINLLALNALKNIFYDNDYKQNTFNWLEKEKSFIFNNISKMDNIKILNSDTNFFLCMHNNITSEYLNKILIDDNIYIRTCNDFVGLNENYFRIAVKLHNSNEKLIEKLADITSDAYHSLNK